MMIEASLKTPALGDVFKDTYNRRCLHRHLYKGCPAPSLCEYPDNLNIANNFGKKKKRGEWVKRMTIGLLTDNSTTTLKLYNRIAHRQFDDHAVARP